MFFLIKIHFIIHFRTIKGFFIFRTKLSKMHPTGIVEFQDFIIPFLREHFLGLYDDLLFVAWFLINFKRNG